MRVGQYQVNKKTCEVRQVFCEVTKDHVLRETDKYKPLVAEMKRLAGVPNIKDTWTKIEPGSCIGQSKACKAFGRTCHVFEPCFRVKENPMSTTLLDQIKKLQAGTGDSFVAPESVPTINVPKTQYPVDDLSAPWANPNTK